MSSKAEVFKEWDNHLLNDSKPSVYFNEIKNNNMLNEHPLSMLKKLEDTPQSEKYHPEGSVWNHTMMVLDVAADKKRLSKNPRVFMWAALLHDIGKPSTTKVSKKKITSYNHDSIGAKLAREFLVEFTDDNKFIDEVCILVRWHMHLLFVVKDLPFAKIDEMLSETTVEELALFGTCDRLGRGNMSEEKIKEEDKNIEIFIKKCKQHLQNKK
ncbi:HDIG domain-containing metalloprotein [Tepidibacter aestuarii]|uniref:HDIG domain-containing metalloprotein n=1 Tax=Tepidibacter aestuarii TaxID=2925782 RepID=UPI0020C0F0F4|nr:HDIG domain-containing metalloprotein [Tepidibacter aestuarii]CAH2213601.1 HDIG domain-containing protein [Tepidibacter aestuarii]